MSSKLEFYGVEAYAYAQSRETEKWFLIIRFRDPRGETRTEFIPRSIVESTQLKSHLAAAGVSLPSKTTECTELLRGLRAAKPKRILITTRMTGWHGDAYVAGAQIYGKFGAEHLVYEGEHAPQSRKGKIKKWRQHVAERAECSSLAMFAICVALAAPLLRFTDVENAIFHVSGPSGAGKSTILKVAESVWGDPFFLNSWHTTRARLEELLGNRNDCFLALDEVGRAASHPNEVRAQLKEAAYLIGNGTPKGLSRNFNGCRPPFRVLAMSSGEVSAAQVASEAGTTRMAGEESRFIDLPVAGFSGGIFDQLDPARTEQAAAFYADGLNSSVGDYFGTAGPAFVEMLCAKIHVVPRKVNRHMASFLLHVRPSPSEQRVAKRFALIYAAGRLALKWGILPWGVKLLQRAILKAYRVAKTSSTTSGEAERRGREGLLSALETGEPLANFKALDALPDRAVLFDAKSNVMFTLGAFDACGTAANRRSWLHELDKMGVLQRTKGKVGSGKAYASQRTVKLKGRSQRLYFYVFDEAALRTWLNDPAGVVDGQSRALASGSDPAK